MSDTDEPEETNLDELTNSVRVPNELPDELIDERLYNIEWLSVQEAAGHFAVSTRAIQKRISKGQLVSRREGREWRIRLVTSKWAYLSVPNTPDEPIGEPVRELNVPNEPFDEPVREPKTALLEQMQSEIAHLREQLQVKDTQIEAGRVAESELRRLLLSRDMEIARLQQENRLLLAAPPVEQEPVQEPSEARQDGRTAQGEANAVNHPQEAETSGQSPQETDTAKSDVTVWDVPVPRKWWRFWDRGR